MEDVCVKVTTENKQRLQKLLPGCLSMAWSIGAYYGIESGNEWGNGKSWGKVITEEELRKILHPEEVINSYQIY